MNSARPAFRRMSKPASPNRPRDERLARLHRHLQNGEIAAKRLQSVADMLLIANRDARRDEDDIGIFRCAPERYLHRRGVIRND
jgi:hypothetical protein